MLIFFVLAFNCMAQVKAEAAKDVSFEMPTGWFEYDGEARLANLRKYELSKEKLDILLANEKATTVLAMFTKGDPTKTPGILLTIQVLLRPMRSEPTFDQFKHAFVRSLKNIGALENYTIIGEIGEKEVSGHRAVLTHSRFTLTHQSRPFEIKARTFAIPRKGHFIQISMSGIDNEDWADTEFTRFIESVQLNK